MEVNDHPHSRLHMLSSHVAEYLDTRWEIIQLNLTERMLNASTTLVSGLLLTFFGGIILVFASIGGAILIGQSLNNPAAGFFIMASVFIVLMILAVIFARNFIRNYITEIVLESIKDKDDEE